MKVIRRGKKVVLSLGMGVDSVALLMRWILEPASRDFDLEDLIVVTAMTGDESQATRDAMETLLLPIMAAHNIRYVQVARAGWSESDGIDILSDSRSTTTMVMRGKVTLSMEMLRAGTIPQLSNRNCSYRFKGWVLDRLSELLFGGAERDHAIGFAAEEVNRKERDEGYSRKVEGKNPIYPLIEWGWDREKCLDYLWGLFGVEWPRSCCGFCQFQAGKDISTMEVRWKREPGQAKLAVRMEAPALALNPRMKLFGDRTAAEVARSFGLGDVVDAAVRDMERQPAAIYEVRRVYRRAGDFREKVAKGSTGGWMLGPDPAVKATKGSAVWRYLRRMHSGRRADMLTLLARYHRIVGGRLEVRDGMALLWLEEAGKQFPTTERCLAISADGLENKWRKSFPHLWRFVKALDMPALPEQMSLLAMPEPPALPRPTSALTMLGMPARSVPPKQMSLLDMLSGQGV